MNRSSRERESRLDLPAIMAVALWGGVGLLTIGALAGQRREEIAAVGLLTAVFVSLVASLGAWLLFHWSRECGDARRRLLDGLLSLGLPAALGITHAGGTSAVTLSVVLLLLALGGAFVAVRELLRGGRGDASVDRERETQPRSASHGDQVENSDPSPHSSFCTAESRINENGNRSRQEWTEPEQADYVEWPSGLTQRITRRQTSDGTDAVEAVLVARFAAGQRDVVLHLPLHPALPASPTCESEPLDGSDVEITVTSCRPYGIRVEVRRAGEVADELDIPIGLHLTAAASKTDAA